MSIYYLEAKDIIKMNVIQIKKYSPNEPIGVKDVNALEMCVGQLQASAFGEEVYPSIYEKAAILLVQLIKKHPFHNANKRTAFLATFVFLKINGQLLAIDQKDAVNLVVYIATYDKDFDQLKYEVINTIKTHTKSI
ncbi:MULTISPECIES: type II toxin-antitoxin system death-on-curing family toxin [Enterococcus]|uniref:Type II toxin-antitoxin system death-on-curing family toxin n=1 Tax=Enterococcus mundtii TaxID=53346 RepID=A0A848MZT9_ENTMU|nr:type II toxin-antitoxin system death-on-curing family toxin [Enterococcus mundtii]MBE9912351.1 type II toxin-antitoxin system death-on-curing family toxin [Enterococcus mundtii]NMP59508.1 type II toxin-antitoxin system death-on-curing family toxin [Enterococcus mundtii]QCJ57946.1 type II toxin-antitoxin system death-on-curing family toxin [Enterococcus mundtii]UBM07154.1 type II toxin-antitoxin system death-on-curing family toxin [Enterococcus mundtii]SFM40779.1 death on curing protein [Ent